MAPAANRWLPLVPKFGQDPAASEDVFTDVVAELEGAAEGGHLFSPDATAAIREMGMVAAVERLGPNAQPVRAAISVLCDLINQGWECRLAGRQAEVRRPIANADRDEEKERVRRALSIVRAEQLAQPSVRQFLTSMVTRQLGPRGWASIHSLMRDGRELAASLRRADELPEGEQRRQALRSAVDPYLQFVNEGDRCDWTGLRLSDVWRYFRYTWLNPAQSVPGRSMPILIRDAAVEPHPVIGIAQLSSAIVQQRARDRWIGWDGESALADLKADPSDSAAAWLLDALQDRLGEIYAVDLVREGHLDADTVAEPIEEVIAGLRALGRDERERHRVRVRKDDYKQLQASQAWDQITLSHLYRSKRALAIADLLDIRRQFVAAGLREAQGMLLREALGKPGFDRAVRLLVRHVKAGRVGVLMMDISVCGAIAPYGPVLGGKLVGMLLTSPEVREEYRRRYGEAESVIASAMRGEPVCRPAELVLLVTTGLFGGGSSQYNRIRVPAERVGGFRGEVRYERLLADNGGGSAKAQTTYGTFHFSQATMDELEIYADQAHEGTDVHGIFGEGVNPKMRKIRAELEALGLQPDELLQSGSPRSIYAVALASNFRDMLLGRDEQPRYIIPTGNPRAATRLIGDYWRERWLSGRVGRAGVLGAVAEHTRDYPMRHGAVVPLPRDPDGYQLGFDEVLDGEDETVW